jgi:hypothetical protein
MIRCLLIALALCHVSVQACSIPVFRYALDRWRADTFRLEAPVDALSTGSIAAEVRNLGDRSPLNLVAKPATDGDARLFFPTRGRADAKAAWTGALTPESFSALVDSPARQEIARRILEGSSAIWVLVESGEKSADEPAAQLLAKRLTFLESAAGIPPIDPTDPSSKLGPGPELGVKLSLLRVRRDAPEEQAFLAQLAGPDGLAAFPAKEPFAALVFGRGRVLGAWGAEKIDEEFIEQATLFLLGACSCEVKNQNPGWDLLMRVDWDAELRKAESARGDSPVATPASTAPQPETVTFTPTIASVAAAPTAPAAQPRWQWALLGLGGVIMVALIARLRAR